jgi:glutathione S-transferase
MRLYHHPLSANSRRAVMTALYLGLPVELALVDLTKSEHRQPSYLGKNPAGRVPVLEDEGFVLPESHAIMIYLAEKTPGQKIYPADIRERAEVHRWMFWCSHHFMPAISVLNWENMVKPLIGLGEPDPAELKRGEKLVIEHAGLLDAHLAGREWIAGATLTLADLSVAACLMTTVVAKLPVLQFENLQAWFGKMQALEVWKKTMPVAPGAKAA